MKKILVVEDETAITKAISIRLKSAGYEALEAYDAVTAVSMTRNHKPDLVVLDINLPGGDGFVVAERISALVSHRLPIIFLTATKNPGYREKAMALGAVAYIEKPYEWKQLLACIEKALEEFAVD